MQHGTVFNGGESPEHSWGIYAGLTRVVCVELLPPSVRDHDQTKADAHLIAAVPDLLSIVSALSQWAETRDSRFSPQLLAFIERARKVVAEAKGEAMAAE